jgi:hypothetical protein
VKDAGKEVEKLGQTLMEQFNLIATGDLNDPVQVGRLQTLAAQGQILQNELAVFFKVTVGEPLKTLKEILAKAEASNLSSAGDLRKAVEQLAIITDELPKNACPTPDGLKKAVRGAVDKPRH